MAHNQRKFDMKHEYNPELTTEERQAENDWRQIHSGIHKAVQYPRKGASCIMAFLEEVRDFMGKGGTGSPAAIPTELLALPGLVKELVRRVGALEDAAKVSVTTEAPESVTDVTATVTATTADPPKETKSGK